MPSGTEDPVSETKVPTTAAFHREELNKMIEAILNEEASEKSDVQIGEYQYGFHDPTDKYTFMSRKGSIGHRRPDLRDEGGTGLDARSSASTALEEFFRRPMPIWGGDMSALDFQNIYYYVKALGSPGKTWDDVPDDIRKTYDRLGIPEAEKKYLAGREGPVRIRSRLRLARRKIWPKQGRDLHRHRFGAARASGVWSASTSARSFRRTTTSSPR